MTTAIARWRGLAALVADAVTHGASAIERVHLATARRPFQIIERAPGIGAPSKGVHAVHDVAVSGVYQSIRAVTGLVAKVVDAGLELADDSTGETEHSASASPKSTR